MTVWITVRAILISGFSLIAGALAYAEDNDTAPVIEQLIGHWSAQGEAFGAPAKSEMRWERDLGGQFIRLSYRIEMERGEDISVFQGVAYYGDLLDGDYRAFWADNSGDLHPIRAREEENALVSNWGVEGGKQGRTRYELAEGGGVQVTDWIKDGDDWRQFNQALFKRTTGAD